MKFQKTLILHLAYPKAGSSYVIENMIKIDQKANIININDDASLLWCFESIRNLTDSKFDISFKKISDLINKKIFKEINFFGYERALNIADNYSNKYRFIIRLMKLLEHTKIQLKVSILIRNQVDIITAQYKEAFFRIIFKKIKYISFQNYINEIINRKNINLIKNLSYYENIKKIEEIIGPQNIFIGLVEELETNSCLLINEIATFSDLKEFNIKAASQDPVNSSTNKKLFELVTKRIIDYISFKKKISIQTFLNFFEIILRGLFLQNYLNNSIKLTNDKNREFIKLFSDSNNKIKELLPKKEMILKKYYL